MGKMKLSLTHGFGGTYPVQPNTVYWNEAKLMAKQISKSHQDKMDSPARTVRLIKADYYSVKGLMFNIIFRVKGVNGVSVAYTAEVWFNVCDEGIKVLTFGKVPGSERKPKNLEIDGSNNSDKKVFTKKMGKEGLDVFKGLSSPVPMTTNSQLDSGKDSSGKLRTRAFYVLLEQIRSQRSWNYSRAKKCASTIWKDLPESEKMIFLSEAAKREKLVLMH